MAIQEILNASSATKASEVLVSEIGKIGLWLQAVGLIVVAWIIFSIIDLLINRKRMKEVYKIKKDMKRIEGKIDKILAKRDDT